MKIDFFSEVVTFIDSPQINELETWLKWHLNLMRFDRAVLFDFGKGGTMQSVCSKYGNRVEYHKFDFCGLSFPQIDWLSGENLHKRAKFSIFVSFEKFLMLPKNGVAINEYLKLISEEWKNSSFNGVVQSNDVQLGLYEKIDSQVLKIIKESEKRLSLIVNSYQQEFPGRAFNCINPRYFTEKMYWLKIYDDTMAKTMCADKLTVGEYCKMKVGADMTIPKIAIYDDVGKIDLRNLPESFVIKCNHGSTMNIVVKDKKKVDWGSMRRKLNQWMMIDYGSTAQEFFYSRIKRRIFVEPLLDFDDSSVIDYKFWCFNGVPKFFTINGNVSKERYSINYYNLDGKFMNICNLAHPANPKFEFHAPDKLSEMTELASKLASNFIFVRVDFYLRGNTVYLGELTFIPGAGKYHWADSNTDIEFGKWLDIMERKKYLGEEISLDNQ